MEWTREVPTKRGWYWFREAGSEARIVRVSDYCGADDLQVTFTGNECESGLSELDGEWHGPLEPPK